MQVKELQGSLAKTGDWIQEGQHSHQLTINKGEEYEEDGQHRECAPFLEEDIAVMDSADTVNVKL